MPTKRKQPLDSLDSLSSPLPGSSSRARQPFRSPFTPRTHTSLPSLPSSSRSSPSTPRPRLPPSSHFRSPLIRNTDTDTTSPSSASNPASSARGSAVLGLEIQRLEQRVQTLKQAVKYSRMDRAGTAQESRAQMADLIDKWTHAGRDAIEMLWKCSGSSALDPSDPSFASSITSSSSSYAFSNSWGWDNSAQTGDNKHHEHDSHNIDKDDGGDDDDDDLPQLHDLAPPTKRHYIKKHPPSTSQDDSSSSPSTSSTHIKWDMAALARIQGVDLSLFGWNADEQDWNEKASSQ